MNELPHVLFPLVMGFLGLKDQKSVSGVSAKFNRWTYETPTWTQDQSSEVEKIRREITDMYTAYSRARVKDKSVDKKALTLLSKIPVGIDEFINTHSTLFGRTFLAQVKQNPETFIKNGNLTPRVVAALRQIPRQAIEAIDKEMASLQNTVDVINIYEDGKLNDFIAMHRDEITEEYKMEQQLNDEEVSEPDDAALFEFTEASTLSSIDAGLKKKA